MPEQERETQPLPVTTEEIYQDTCSPIHYGIAYALGFIGFGAGIAMGIGGCSYLYSKGEAEKTRARNEQMYLTNVIMRSSSSVSNLESSIRKYDFPKSP